MIFSAFGLAFNIFVSYVPLSPPIPLLALPHTHLVLHDQIRECVPIIEEGRVRPTAILQTDALLYQRGSACSICLVTSGWKAGQRPCTFRAARAVFVFLGLGIRPSGTFLAGLSALFRS